MLFRLITVDVTNTLIRFRKPPSEQYRDIAGLYGIELDRKAVSESLRNSLKHHLCFSPNFGYKDKGWVSWWQNVIRDTFVQAGARESDSRLETIGNHLLKHFTTSEAYEILPHCKLLLQFLSDKPVVLGALSNTDERLEKVLFALGLRHYFDFVLSSFEAGGAKPGQKIFQSALIKTGKDIKASESLHIGDSLKVDFLGAENAGWHSFLVSETYKEQCLELNVKCNEESMFSNLEELRLKLEKF